MRIGRNKLSIAIQLQVVDPRRDENIFNRATHREMLGAGEANVPDAYLRK